MSGFKRQLWRSRARRALRTPIRDWVSEGTLRVRRKAFPERWIGGLAWRPYSVGLWLTEACDLNCRMCWVRPGSAGAGPDDQALSQDDWFRLIDELAAWRPRLTITGGEPLLVPYLADLIRYASDKGLRINLGTNGTRLDYFAEELVTSGLQDLSVSLDGPLGVHDRIRGKDGVFDAVRQGIARILEIRRRHESPMPYVRLNCTLTKTNQGSLKDVLSLAQEWGVDSLSFQHLWSITPEILRHHNHRFEQVFQQESPNLTGFLVDGLSPEPVSLAKELAQLSSARHRLPVYVYPQLEADQVRQYYRQPDVALKSHCCSRWFRADIKPNGDVTPCLSFVAGNVRQEPFRAIWNNDRYRMFRRQLLTGLFPGCHRCCGLFSD